MNFPGIEESGKNCSPPLIANFIFELAKEYNQFYHDHPVLKEPGHMAKGNSGSVVGHDRQSH
jgi:arginyl-tRNA synthetase